MRPTLARARGKRTGASRLETLEPGHRLPRNGPLHPGSGGASRRIAVDLTRRNHHQRSTPFAAPEPHGPGAVSHGGSLTKTSRVESQRLETGATLTAADAEFLGRTNLHSAG